MTKAMTVSERRKAKKAHAEFLASMAPQPGQEGPAAAFLTPAKAAPERMKPTVQARAQAAYEEVAADTKGAKHFRRKIACLLDLLESRRTITRQECEAGKRYEADHRLVWGTSGRDSCIPPVGGVVHETEAQAERIVRAKARMTKVLAKAGPAAFALLRQVAAYEQPLGKQNTKERVGRYASLKMALNAAASVYGVPSYEEMKEAY